MDGKINLSIIIVNWNVRDLLQKCLTSIYKNSQGIFLEVFVVDNASSDSSAEMVRQDFPQAKLIESEENLGFAKANNLAIKQSKGQFILLLNPDTEILPNSLQNMVKFMEANKDCGVAGCKILNPDKTLQPSVRRFPTLYSQIIVLTKLHNFFPRLIKKYLALDLNYEKVQEVDQVMGAFFLIKREVLDKVGFLDEKFYIWFEEVDFCKRTKDVGFKILYTPEVEIIHHGGQSFKQVLSYKKQKIFNKSLARYFKQHYSFLSYVVIKIFSFVSLFLVIILSGIKNK